MRRLNIVSVNTGSFDTQWFTEAMLTEGMAGPDSLSISQVFSYHLAPDIIP